MIHEYSQWLEWVVRDFKVVQLEKLLKEKIHVDDFFQIGKEHEDTVSYVKVNQNMI